MAANLIATSTPEGMNPFNDIKVCHPNGDQRILSATQTNVSLALNDSSKPSYITRLHQSPHLSAA